MIDVDNHFIKLLADEYYQLYIPITAGISSTEVYKDAALKGHIPFNHDLGLILDEKDIYEEISTEYGDVRYIYLYNRLDFENAVRKLAYKCEPLEIPKTMGAIIILGVNNWKKIKLHKLQCEANGNFDWKSEFRSFTSIKKNYKDTLIIISDGCYSNLSHIHTKFNEEQWKYISMNIRKYHELTHFICMNKYHELKQPIFDEILADCIGITYALGHYDKKLACMFIGIIDNHYQSGGRLENYIDKNFITHELVIEILNLMDMLEAITKEIMEKEQIEIHRSSINDLECLISNIYMKENVLSQIILLNQLTKLCVNK